MRRLIRSRRGRVLLGAAVGALVIAGIVGARAGLFARDHVKVVTVEQALQRFRDNDQAVQQLEGVYAVDTTGSESVDVLGGARHRYPATTTLTVTRSACGLHLDWRALEGRSTTWDLCSTPDGSELRATSEQHRFFWETDTTRYTCTGALLTAAAGTAATTTLSADRRGPAAVRRYHCITAKGFEDGEIHELGIDNVLVGDVTHTAVHVLTTATIGGATRGTETVEWWLDTETALPLRIVLSSRSGRNTIVGNVHYREDADLRLSSLVPRR